MSGNSNVTSVVLVKVGTRVSRMEWEAELVDWMPSVDETGPWATIQRVPVVSQYTEIAGPNTVAVTQSGFELTALPNTDTDAGVRCALRPRTVRCRITNCSSTASWPMLRWCRRSNR
ncbi:MAG: hypothetical protein ACLSGF_06480 [Alistipes onderdonkii]